MRAVMVFVMGSLQSELMPAVDAAEGDNIMSLDMKHKNIGATVGLVKGLTEALGEDGNLSNELASLFMLEAEECDFRMTKTAEPCCVFNGSTKPNLKCCVGECPLGAIVDEEIRNTPKSVIDDRVSLYGKNTMGFGADPEKVSMPTTGGHIHIGYTGWRKLWREWLSWFKGWGPYLRKNWKINLLIVIGVLAVDQLSKNAGTLSAYLW